MRRVLLALSFGALVASSGSAAAATLISPPLVAEGTNVLDCYLINIGPVTRQVVIEVLNREGNVVKRVRTELAPFEEDVARTTAAERGRVCRFIVPGSRFQYRASILVRQEGVGAISALSAF